MRGWAILGAAALVLAGCGGDDDDDESFNEPAVRAVLAEAAGDTPTADQLGAIEEVVESTRANCAERDVSLAVFAATIDQSMPRPMSLSLLRAGCPTFHAEVVAELNE